MTEVIEQLLEILPSLVIEDSQWLNIESVMLLNLLEIVAGSIFDDTQGS